MTKSFADRIRQAAQRFLSHFRAPALDRDLEAELQSHLQFAIDENLRRGLSPAEARRQALVQFGGVQQARETQREARSLPPLDEIRQDLRYTFRSLRRDMSFAAIAILILALAIGANIGVFSVVNTLLLRPLPFPDSQQLVWIAPTSTNCGLSCSTYSADAFEEFRAQSLAYQDVSGYEAFTTPDNLRFTGGGEPIPATSIAVIGNFFQVLGVQPFLGRLFSEDEVRGGPHPVALLTYPYWQRQFNSDRRIVGKSIDLNGNPITVVGVLPPAFDYGAVFSPGSKVDLFTPLDLNLERNWGNIVTLIGRLKPSLTIPQALADARRIDSNLYFNTKYPQTLGRYKGQLIPVSLKDYVAGKLRRSLIALWAAVGTILLIAGVNLSTLLLSRSAARSKEFALRAALGANRGRIVRQLLLESLVLSSLGAGCGLMLAAIVISWLAHQSLFALPLLSSLRLDVKALLWAALVTLLTAVLFGLLPALRMASGNLLESLKDSGPGAGLGRKHDRLRTGLVISEVALACMLLISAGLLLRSFVHVLNTDLGFEPDRAASIKVEYDDSAATEEASGNKRAVLFSEILARISALPGVEADGMADYLPLGPNREWGTPLPKGKIFNPGDLPSPLVYVITPGFFRAMGIRLRGRDFTWADGPNTEQVVLINESAARVYWPDQDAVGQLLMRGDDAIRVIGVVDDVHEQHVESGAGSQIYYPVTQQGPNGAQLVIRTSLPPASLAQSILRTLRELNPRQPAAEFRPIRTIVDRAVSPRRFFMLLVASFAALGLLLAALGIYGVISYMVTRQRQEMGIRMALGASRSHVLSAIVSRALRLAFVGIAIGAAFSFVAGRWLASLLYRTKPSDPLTFVGMLIIFALVAALAGYLPALRASRVNPLEALRAE